MRIRKAPEMGTMDKETECTRLQKGNQKILLSKEKKY